jgi:hypothetical protein
VLCVCAACVRASAPCVCVPIPDQAPSLGASEYPRAFRYGAGSYRPPAPLTAPIKSKRGQPFAPGGGSAIEQCFPGLRSEEMITVGQYTPVLRTGSPRAGYTAG